MNQFKRVVSLLICFVMLVGFLPMGVFATGIDTNDAPSASTQPTTDADLTVTEDALITTATSEEAKTYVLVSTPTAGKNYIIASGNSGEVYALTENTTTGTAVTVNTATDSITAPYIEASDNSIVWTASSGMKFQSVKGGYYLNYSENSTYGYDLSFGTSSGSDWTAGTNALYYDGGLIDSYLRYNNGWAMSYFSSGYNVYFYEEQTVETVTLSSIAVTTAPTTIVYNVGDTFSEEGLVVTATYSDGSTKAVTGYTLSGYDMNTAGEQTVTVTYTEGGVTQTATFTITVSKSLSADATVTGIQVSGAKTNYSLGESFTTEGMVVTATYSDGTTALVTDYTVSEVDMTTEGTKIVTVSYTYNGTTVTTTFDITVTGEDSNEVTLEGSTTTTTTKTVYVRTSSISSGNSYLIVNGNSAGSYYALANNSGSVTATGVTVKSGDVDGDGDTETYIELDSATNELWTASGSSSTTLKNGNYYLRYDNGLDLSRNNSTTWSYSNNRLSYKSGSTTYYLRYNNGWTVTNNNSNASSIYFYVPTEIEVETTTDTTVTYTMRAENLKQVVVEGNEATLSAELDYFLQGNGADLTTLPTGGSYSFSVLSDANGIIKTIGTDGTVTFTGNTGTAKVKVAYTWTVDGVTYTVYNNITVEATDPYYTLDLHHAVYTFTKASITAFESGVTYYVQNADGTYSVTTDTEYVSGTTYYTATVSVGDEITETVAIKGIEAGDTYSAWAVIKYYDGVVENGEDGEDLGDINDNDIEWTSSDTTIATVDAATGIITFTGKEGSVRITATYKNGNKPSDTINISVTASQYSVPSDGTNDFPEYPNEGAIRYDKTATAVGNFSETGIAQVELSMTGVPYSTGSEIDVVIMLDQSTSMDDNRISATVAATKAFIKSIVINEDGTYNSNRIYVGYFNGSKTYDITDSANIGGDLASIDSDTELDKLFAAIDDEFDGSPSTSGTEYGVALEKCYTRLNSAKTDGIGNDHQQFCVFMSDGVPTTLQVGENSMLGTSGTPNNGYDAMKGMFTGTNYNTRSSSYQYEYYSTQMKANGVTVYTVGLGLEATNSAWSGASSAQCLNAASLLLNDIAGPAKETTKDTGSTLSKKDSYFFSVEDADAAANMTNVFQNIAVSILQAATNVTVEDQITKEYTMIFDIPEGDKEISGLDSQEFYIEFVKYTLDENHERTTETSITKLYLGQSNGSYYAASDSNDTAYASPVFAQTTIGDKGTLYYWTTQQTYSAKAAVSYTDGTTTYYFIPYGMAANDDGSAPTGWYNMTSGAYASGTIDEETNMSTNLVIATPYFVYNAATKMLYWTVDKLDTYEYALRYFLYLNNSATEVGTDDEVDAKTYPTNNHAYITYTNFRGNDCRQVFPVPQLTWNGAQVSYVFYLVNSAGQPINKSGQVVDFANAVFVTDVYTQAVVWNKGEDGQVDGSSNLSIDWLAANLLPEEYMIYDENAGYELHVYADASGESIFNYFIIEGSEATDISASLNERLELETTASTVSKATTKVYNTKAGSKYTDYGVYTSKATNDYDGETVLSGFDFANTTVAFAVVWESKLVEDVVVVDYGLDVLINVVQNDLLQNTVSGIGLGNDAYGSIPMNTGVSTTPKLGTDALTLDGNTISIENENQIRFHQGDMEFENAVTFYYESPVKYYEGSNQKDGYMYSSVTVIPATTIYYEDDYVALSGYTWNYDKEDWVKDDSNSAWSKVGDTISATQDVDRPGENKVGAGYDADNVYGYDSAYTTSSLYSLGSAMKATVDYDNYAKAEFTFCGTGFDIIGLTSNTTGGVFVTVTDSEGNVVATNVVDTYYGYAYDADSDEWKVVDSDDSNALYQIPVMEYSGLTYGTYTVTLQVVYNALFEHGQSDDNNGDGLADTYEFYLDAIRIYDPIDPGKQGSDDLGAYEKDNEGWPYYVELRNEIIDAKALLGKDSTTGAVFIDGKADGSASLKDYISYGPNNELYLANGQAIAFKMDLSKYTVNGKSIVADVQIGLKTVSGTTSYKIYNAENVKSKTEVSDVALNTATDMYYSIKALTGGTIVILNSGDGILSITNIKITFTENPGTVDDPETSVPATGNESSEEPSEAQTASIVTSSIVTSNGGNLLSSSSEDTDVTVTETTEDLGLIYITAAGAEKAVQTLTVLPEPEVFEPETLVVRSMSTSVFRGSKVPVLVTTSTDVESITINGVTYTRFVENKRTGVRVWATVLRAEIVGTMTIEVIAYNEDGLASDPVSVNIWVSGNRFNDRFTRID